MSHLFDYEFSNLGSVMLGYLANTGGAVKSNTVSGVVLASTLGENLTPYSESCSQLYNTHQLGDNEIVAELEIVYYDIIFSSLLPKLHQSSPYIIKDIEDLLEGVSKEIFQTYWRYPSKIVPAAIYRASLEEDSELVLELLWLDQIFEAVICRILPISARKDLKEYIESINSYGDFLESYIDLNGLTMF